MNIQIYKYTIPSDVLEYFIFDKDSSEEVMLNASPDDLFLKGLAVTVGPEGKCSILSTIRPVKHLQNNTIESSFLDLLVVTGFSKAIMEFFFTNFPLESFTITIRPQTIPTAGLFITNTITSGSGIFVCPASGSALTVNSSNASGISIHQSNISTGFTV